MSQPSTPQSPEPASFGEWFHSELLEARDGRARVRMPIRKYHLQDAGAVQGGLIMTLADGAFWRAVLTLLAPGQRAATSELKVNFIRPARGDYLVAESRIVHKGDRLVVGDTEVKDDRGNLVAKALGTYIIIEPQGLP